MKFDLTILIIIIPIAISFFGMYKIFKFADKFFRKCDLIEAWIKAGEPIDKVVPEIFNLSKQSFHRQTGQRLREIAKMAEIKYDINLIKD